MVVMLVGNKTDLKDKREVSTQEGSEYAMREGLAFIETSAMNANNIEIAFSTIIFCKCFLFFN